MADKHVTPHHAAAGRLAAHVTRQMYVLAQRLDLSWSIAITDTAAACMRTGLRVHDKFETRQWMDCSDSAGQLLRLDSGCHQVDSL